MDISSLHIALAPDEIETLQGVRGPILQKVMESVVLYGEAIGASRLVDLEGPGHFVIPWSVQGIAPPLKMLEELAAAGVKTKFPFTLDPRPPMDFENLNLEPEVEEAIRKMHANQDRYDELMVALGLRDKDAYTCNPYQPEVGNVPQRGMILAWSESACAIYANSVLGARTNRNGAIMDLLQNIVGKTPLAGLLTDEGRRADWLVELRTRTRPNPHLLGAAIGLKVLAGVPYISGLDRFLQSQAEAERTDYLQGMGAMLATYSAVSLFHAEHLTPEAVDQGRSLLLPGHQTYVIDEDELARLLNSFPNRWTDPHAKPEKCYIGCPHLSLRELYWWADAIKRGLKAGGKDRLAVETILCAAPQVLRKFKADEATWKQLQSAGVRLSPGCSEVIFETRLCTGRPVITNSNKLRAYTSARFLPDEALVHVLVSGAMERGR